MTREEAKYAFGSAISEEYELELIKYDDAAPAFSKEFTDKMDQLIKKEKNPLWHLVNTRSKKILMLFLCCITMLLTLNTIPEVKAYTFEFLENIFATHIELKRSPEKTLSEIKEYKITALPANYQLSSQIHGPGTIMHEYTSKDGTIITLEQYTVSGITSIAYDQEAGIETEITLGNYPAHLYKNHNYFSMSWCTEDATLKLSCYGELAEDEFINIGLSVKPDE